MQETWVWSLGWKDPLEKGMTTLSSVFLPGEFHGWRSLAGCSPWDHKESDMTERLMLHFNSTCYQSTLHSSASRMLTARLIFLRHEIIGFCFGETITQSKDLQIVPRGDPPMKWPDALTLKQMVKLTSQQSPLYRTSNSLFGSSCLNVNL